MFAEGEYIIYGQNGICKVENITYLELSGIRRDKLYYVLLPIGTRGSKIYSPVENDKVVIRRVLTGEEAGKLIDEIPDMEEIWAENDKLREEKYKSAMKSCDCRQWVRIIKTLYLKKQKRLVQGKKINMTDERYLKQAKENLYSELALAMKKEKSEMEAFITERIELMKTIKEEKK